MVTVTDRSVNLAQDAPSETLLPAARMLAAEGITPGHVWAWDVNRFDPELRDPACLNLAETLAYVLGEPSPLESYLSDRAVAAVLEASRP